VIQCWHDGRVCVCIEWNMESSLNWECQWWTNRMILSDWRTNLHFSFLEWNIASRGESVTHEGGSSMVGMGSRFAYLMIRTIWLKIIGENQFTFFWILKNFTSWGKLKKLFSEIL
jgi:hypothetical protein